MASEATKMVVIGNMHMDVRVIEVTELNSEVRSDLQGHYHCHPLVFRAIALLLLYLSTKDRNPWIYEDDDALRLGFVLRGTPNGDDGEWPSSDCEHAEGAGGWSEERTIA